ncbi:hypothetical protein K501DRAFT_300313 [Backusella circina FSU 941]|nr:hypothetical protein K501DRAFT_300313 [Backusella circina FSU 941]
MKEQLSITFNGSLLRNLRESPPSAPSLPYSTPLSFTSNHLRQQITHKLSRRKAPSEDHIRAEMILPILQVVSSLIYILF